MTPPAADEVIHLLCEDVREESDGRLTLVGLYGPTIRVQKLPNLVRVCSVLLLRNPGKLPQPVFVRATGPEGNVLVEFGREDPPPANTPESFTSQRVAKIFPLKVEKPGLYTFAFQFGVDRRVGVERAVTVLVEEKPQYSPTGAHRV